MKVLIKLGGTLLDDAASRQSLARQIAKITGHQLCIVHGGGRQLSRFLEAQGVPSNFVNGLRITTDDAVDGVIQILAGLVNKRLVAALRAEGANPVGISGIDGNLTTSAQLNPELGWVGKITASDASLVNLLASAGHIPVVACLSGDDDGGVWNVNADQMAAACARAFQADRLIFLTDVAGVLDGAGKRIPTLTGSAVRELIGSGIVRGGMQAKLESATSVIGRGAASVIIANGAESNVIARLLAGESIGTEVKGTEVKNA